MAGFDSLHGNFFAASIWDPHQQYLIDKIQRRVRPIYLNIMHAITSVTNMLMQSITMAYLATVVMSHRFTDHT